MNSPRNFGPNAFLNGRKRLKREEVPAPLRQRHMFDGVLVKEQMFEGVLVENR